VTGSAVILFVIRVIGHREPAGDRMRQFTVSSRFDVTSPYAEVMFTPGDKRKYSEFSSMDQRPADSASADHQSNDN
jgi:hypothetical protein